MTVLTEPPDLGEVAPVDPVALERTRLAYAVHDGLTQVVTASVLELEWLARQVESDPAATKDVLERAAAELRKALDEIRDMLATMSPEEPRGADRLDDLVRGVMERWQLPATWEIEGDLHSVPDRVLEAASAVIREGVANAAKHSASHAVQVRVAATEEALEVCVEDHGRGFEPASTCVSNGHLGLEMMRRRVAEQGGRLDVESAPGIGNAGGRPAARPQARRTAVRILIVDDHALVRRGMGHVVRECFTQAEVLEVRQCLRGAARDGLDRGRRGPGGRPDARLGRPGAATRDEAALARRPGHHADVVRSCPLRAPCPR